MSRTPPPDPHIDILGLYTPEAQGLGGFETPTILKDNIWKTQDFEQVLKTKDFERQNLENQGF